MIGRVVVVGGGILGTMHALAAVERGWDVVHLDRDVEPRSASVRNFGLVWVSGRAPGAELDLALTARLRWEEIAGRVPGVGLRPDGSLTLVQTEAERAVLDEVVARPDAAARGIEVLEPDAARAVNPVLRGVFVAALWCRTDAVVEPRRALPALRDHLLESGRYTWCPATTIVDVDAGVVVDQTGARHHGDIVIVCPGGRTDGPIGGLVAGAPLRRVRLQMMETAPLGERCTTSFADGGSLRYYPGFAGPALDALPPADEIVARHHMQLLVAQRADGSLTVGDTHEYDEPFDFAVSEEPYAWLRARLEALLGRPAPPTVRRWAGVYSQRTDGGIVHRSMVMPGVIVVTGPGGRGMTLSPAIADETFDGLEAR